MIVLLLLVRSVLAIGLVDLHVDDVEVELSALVGGSEEGVSFKICPDARVPFSAECRGSGIETIIPFEKFKERVERFYGLDLEEDREEESRKKTFLWIRDHFRARVDEGASESATNAMQALLQGLVDKTASVESAAVRERAKASARRIIDGLDGEKTYFRQLHAEYGAILSAFAGWIDASICRCELSTDQGFEAEPQCVLKKGKAVLASSPAALGACQSRKSCRRRRWHSLAPPHGGVDFQKILDVDCSGYFLSGAVTRGNFLSTPSQEGE